MADNVDHQMERMLLELEDLEKRGLFTPSEIREVVSKRRNFEYQLKRSRTLKPDFLRYIEFELKFDTLRKLRKKRIARGLKESAEKWKPSVSDKAGRRRVLRIYERAVTRFKGDLNLWLQYLEFCKSQAPTRMKKAATKCLRLHPTVPGLWIYAAAWEFEHNLNVKAARALMQRGIRMCPQAENIWLEYFRLELTYMQKLKARRVVLGLELSTSSTGSQMSSDKLGEKQYTSTSVVGGDKVSDSAERASGGNGLSVEDELSFKLAQSVYKNATAAVQSSLGFRQRFLQALDAYEFENKDVLEKEIEGSIAHDFSDNELSWDWLARRCVDSERKAIEVFEAALQVHPTTRLYELYAKYLTDVLDSNVESTSGSEFGLTDTISDVVNDIRQTLLCLYERMMVALVYSDVLATGHIELLLRSGEAEEALRLAEKYCNVKELKKSPATWEWRITLEARKRAHAGGTADEDRLTSILEIFQDATKNVPFAQSKRLWLLALEVCGGREEYVNIFVELLVTALSGNSGGQVGSDITCALVGGILSSQGINRARKLYYRFLGLPGPSSTFIKFCITMESRHVQIGCKDAIQHLRKLFSAAIGSCGQADTELWIDYYRVEMKAGNVDAANKVHWMARRALKDPTEFLEKHQAL